MSIVKMGNNATLCRIYKFQCSEEKKSFQIITSRIFSAEASLCDQKSLSSDAVSEESDCMSIDMRFLPDLSRNTLLLPSQKNR